MASTTIKGKRMTGDSRPSRVFPPVVLNATLHDFLLAESQDSDVETLCHLKPNADLQYGEAVPLNQKYIIHSAQVDSADDLAHLQLENCSHLLMFFAGPMDVVFLAADGQSDDPTLSQQSIDQNARRSFGIIQESQRPRITTYANSKDFVNRHGETKVRWGFAMDFAQQLPSVYHPDLVYKLNSKRWLADCDLKSANDTIIDCEIRCPDHVTDNKQWYFGGSGCTCCASGIESEIERVTKILQRPAPFVLKLTQSLSSVGTVIVKDDEGKMKLVKSVQDYLRDYLPRTTEENAHLYTTTLIMSDFIPGETMALNFFVRRDGSTVFIGACHQQSTGESGRQATAITYADQEKLEQKYRKTLEQIGQTLHSEGYYGPCGADVMEDPSDGSLFTIDLNVRSALSLVLYLLREHFHERRGLGMSIVYECIILKISREELEDKFTKEFEEGRIVLLGSFRMGEKKRWGYGVIVAGKDQKDIDDLSDRILEFEIDGGQAPDAGGA